MNLQASIENFKVMTHFDEEPIDTFGILFLFYVQIEKKCRSQAKLSVWETWHVSWHVTVMNSHSFYQCC